MTISPDFRPQNAAELAQCLADPMWRLTSGAIYTVMLKSETPGAGIIEPFRPNETQLRLMKRLWHRNIVLKARQLGVTTLVAILWLDHALFNADQRCGIIAQDLESAEAIFRDKVKAVYDRMPQELRRAMPLERDSSKELLFAHNNSSVRVATSMRSGTINRLHVSEFGKICSDSPEKAAEVVTGSLPAVPSEGVVIIESTAKGQDGAFYKMTERSRALSEAGNKLAPADYRFHFFPWFDDPTYRIETDTVAVSPKDHEYFDMVEASEKVQIELSQRRWYVAKRDNDFSGDQETMWQEFPSTPLEAFQVSTEGTYYAVQLAKTRKDGRIGRVPYNESYPVNTFWDIGSSDGTGIWLHQKIGQEHHFIGYIEAWGEPYIYFIRKLQELGYVWGKHYLPHDAAHKRQQGHTVQSAKDALRKMGIGGSWLIVPQVPDVVHGINLTRAAFGRCWFDADACKEGLVHLSLYRKEWDERGSRWRDYPKKDIHAEAADAFRQFGQIETRVGETRRSAGDSEEETPAVGGWMAG